MPIIYIFGKVLVTSKLVIKYLATANEMDMVKQS